MGPFRLIILTAVFIPLGLLLMGGTLLVRFGILAPREKRLRPQEAAASHMLARVDEAHRRGETFVLTVPTPWVGTVFVLVWAIFLLPAVLLIPSEPFNYLAAAVVGFVIVLAVVKQPPWPREALRLDPRTLQLRGKPPLDFTRVSTLNRRTEVSSERDADGDSSLVVTHFADLVAADGTVLATIDNGDLGWNFPYVSACVQALMDIRDRRDPRGRPMYRPELPRWHNGRRMFWV